MPARSRIALLPDEIRDELERKLLTGGFSDYAALESWLRDQGFEISRSAIHRFGKDFQAKCEAIKIATEQAKAIVGVVGDDEGNMNEALIRLIQQLSFDILVKNQDEDIVDILPKMGVMIAKLSKASVDQKKWATEMRKKTLLEAADTVEETARERGLSEADVQFWRERVLKGTA